MKKGKKKIEKKEKKKERKKSYKYHKLQQVENNKFDLDLLMQN